VKGYIKKRCRVDSKTGKRRTSRVWTVVYDEPVARGEKRRQKMKSGFSTRKAAEKWFERKREQVERGFTGIDDKTTITDYFAHWLRGVEVGAAAYHQYETYARRFIVPTLGRIRLCDLKPSHLEDAKRTWTIKRKDKGEGTIAPRTVRHIWTTLSVALNRAKKQRIILFNPCEVVDAPRFEGKEMRALDGAAAEQYIRAFYDNPDIGAAVVLAIGSGLRRGELLALSWSDVDLDVGTIRVARSLERAILHDADDPQKKTVEVRFKEPKTRGSRRTIPLPAFAVERLRSHRREQKDRFDALGLWRTNDSLVFDREGRPWCPNTFGLWFARLVKRFELPRVRLQDLRHSYASLMLESGVDLKTVSTALGHSTIRVTADTYAHVSPAMLQSAAARLDQAMRRASASRERNS
jgi:integrase